MLVFRFVIQLKVTPSGMQLLSVNFLSPHFNKNIRNIVLIRLLLKEKLVMNDGCIRSYLLIIHLFMWTLLYKYIV